MTKIVTQFRVPKKLLTDRGANFTSALIKETCKLLKIQKLQTSSYNPQANGVCERMHNLLIDMLSHFVRKDAKNWDEYVPYAVMAYRAMPHSTTKYSPYYLVYGREMRLPIEDDWKPSSNNVKIAGNEYEQHVKELAERLREANKTAGQQSKMSHDTSKRYYDRNTKIEQFKKGDYVYVHNPVYKRGKANKFSYQYDGPFRVEQKISSLIFKVRLGDGTSTILHINRLKRAHEQNTGNRVLPEEKLERTNNELLQLKRSSCGRRKNYMKEREFEEVASPPTARLEVQEEDKETENELLGADSGDPEWVPRSSYLQRKSQSTTADNVAYRLRSRLVGRSERETEVDSEQVEAGSLQESENVSVNTHDKTPPSKNKPVMSH